MTQQQLAEPAATGRDGGRAWTRTAFGFFVAVATLAVVALVLEVAWLRPAYSDVRSQAQDRREVIAAAEHFAVLANTYDASSIDDYLAEVSPLLTTKFQTAFETTMKDLSQVVQAGKMKSEGQVLQSAVASIDPDSATVLVVADATVTTVYDTRERHFRWQVDLVKVDGSWLVDNFDAVQ